MAANPERQLNERRGQAAAEKEKGEMEERKHVERVMSVLETEKCGLFELSDLVPRKVVFRYEEGGPDGGYSLVSNFDNEEDSRRILSWLRANADPDAYGCGLRHSEVDCFPID